MGLSVSLKKKVNGFSLDVEWEIGDELAVLFGYSGAGKSMTLQAISGLMEPDEGTIRIDGTVYFDSAAKINVPAQLRSCGYVFQDLALFPHMTVRDNIRYGASGLKKSEREEALIKMMSAFRLNGLENRLPSEISGGQKQRVTLARALIRRPGLLLLDEPFSALDNPVRAEMRKILSDIRREFTIPVILVTHDMSEAYSLADRMIIYAGGKVVQAGVPSEILHSPVSPDVEALINPPGFIRPSGDAFSFLPLPISS
ncbi:MAG: ATP-binding cassette domain-containing protein [Nitrospiraceae bacterium]|nr:ATP-binding cassette domain-containing protein [Nitrospiraceae bacterium]